MINFIDLALIITAILNLGIGILVYLGKRASPVNISYAVLSLSAAFWIFGQLIMRNSQTVAIAALGAHIGYLSAVFIPAFLVYFSHIFPFRIQMSIYKKVFLWGASFMIAIISVVPTFMIKEIRMQYWGKEVILGWPYHIYSLYFLVFMAWSLRNLFLKYIQISGLTIEKFQLRYVLAGLIPSAIFGLTFNLILPWVGNYTMIWLGPLFTIIMVVAIAYAIQKHHLMDVRVVATELFTGLIAITLLIQIFFVKNFQDFFIRLGTFILILVFSYFLLKGTIREVNELRRLSEAKSEFISIASHQLRSPLTAIKGYVSMLFDGSFGTVDGQIKGILSKIYLSNERLIKLVEDLLNISKIEEGKLEFDFQKVNINDIIQSVVDELKSLAYEKGLTISFQPWPLSSIKLDPLKIRQVVTNLLDNAIKYTEMGGVFIEVKGHELGTGNNKKFIVVAVKDTGIGMTQEEIDGLFERFHRGVRIPKIHPEGSGLGLYIAKKIVEAHGGRIWAESEGKGKGSAFFVELPLG